MSAEAVNPCLEAATTVPMDSEVEVIGLGKINHRPLLASFFCESKAWILSLWKGRSDQIKSMTICSKFIGRNEGFIVHVKCTGPDSTTTFFAKVQHASMDTVLIHHLLKNMKCGSDRFFITLLKERRSYFHGVITEEVNDWTMTSHLVYFEPNFLLSRKKQLATTTFLLTLLIELGRFGNIPNNRDNWGFVDSDSVPYPHMSMIDFSRGGREKNTFICQSSFLTCWQDCLEYLFQKWQPRCGPIEDLQLFRDRLADFHKSLKHSTCIEDEIQHFPFLQSREALLEVLQSACDETALWLHDAVERARESFLQYPSNTMAEHTEHKILVAFRFKPKPVVGGVSPYGYSGLLLEYDSLVDEWNVCVGQLLKWFPFPNKGDSSTSGADHSVAPGSVSTADASKATDSLSATGMPNNDTDIPSMMHAAAL